MSGGEPPRYAPTRAFPPYAFLPGRDPHPTGDPRGHSFGAERALPPHLGPERWREDEGYLHGVDLYNHGYFWEAHEAWEGRWHQARGDALHADFLQGLIQCAAATLKLRLDQPRGLERLCEMGTARLERVAREAGPHYMGLDLPAFVDAFRSFASSATSADQRPLLLLNWATSES